MPRYISSERCTLCKSKAVSYVKGADLCPKAEADVEYRLCGHCSCVERDLDAPTDKPHDPGMYLAWLHEALDPPGNAELRAKLLSRFIDNEGFDYDDVLDALKRVMLADAKLADADERDSESAAFCRRAAQAVEPALRRLEERRQ
jgi:hypothetical protein